MLSLLTFACKWRSRAAVSHTEAPHKKSETKDVHEAALARFAEHLQAALGAADWRLLGKYLTGYSYEELSLMLDAPIEKIKSEEARLRWALRRFVKEHGCDQNGNPLVQSFLRRAFTRLSR